MRQQALDRVAQQQAILEGAGYEVKGSETKNGKRVWTFIHLACGTEQSMVFGNIQAGLKKDPLNPPCSNCGSKRRMFPAIQANAKNG